MKVTVPSSNSNGHKSTTVFDKLANLAHSGIDRTADLGNRTAPKVQNGLSRMFGAIGRGSDRLSKKLAR